MTNLKRQILELSLILRQTTYALIFLQFVMTPLASAQTADTSLMPLSTFANDHKEEQLLPQMKFRQKLNSIQPIAAREPLDSKAQPEELKNDSLRKKKFFEKLNTINSKLALLPVDESVKEPAPIVYDPIKSAAAVPAKRCFLCGLPAVPVKVPEVTSTPSQPAAASIPLADDGSAASTPAEPPAKTIEDEDLVAFQVDNATKFSKIAKGPSVKVGDKAETYAMREQAALPAGTVIGIPRRFFQMAQDDMDKMGRVGKPSMDLVYYHWLKQDQYEMENGEIKRDSNGKKILKANGAGAYIDGDGLEDEFYPVRVIAPGKSKDGSTVDVGDLNSEIYVPLRKLNLTHVAADAAGDRTILQNADIKAYKRVEESTFGSGMEGQSDCTDCRTIDGSPSVTNLRKFINSYIAKDLLEIHAGMTANRAGLVNKTAKNFTSSCGLEFSDMKQILENKEQKEISTAELSGKKLLKIPTSIMMSIMSRESTGDCFAVSGRNPNDGGYDVGLFQVHVKPYHRADGKIVYLSPGGTGLCSAPQKAAIHRLLHSYSDVQNPGAQSRTLSDLESPGLKCLQNPIVDADEAKAIIRSKAVALAKGGFDFKNMNRQNAWLMTMAAYNGGESPVLQAKNMLLSFNQKYGSHLDPNNWNELRIFIAKEALNSRLDLHKTAYKQKLSMMTYAESIVGLPGSREEGLADTWTEKLIKY